MRLAATVMLLRDGKPGVEVLMVRRSTKSTFAPDAFVFPGGTVDPADYAEQTDGWTQTLGSQFRAYVADALPSSEAPISPRDAAALLRAAVREFAEEVAVELDPASLLLFSHWITPPTEPRRYNTHFFVATAADGIHGTADAVETHDAAWIAPSLALERNQRAEMHLVYPTIKHLERLAQFRTAAQALEYTRDKSIITIMPDRAPHEGFIMPPQLENAW